LFLAHNLKIYDWQEEDYKAQSLLAQLLQQEFVIFQLIKEVAFDLMRVVIFIIIKQVI